MGYRALVEKQVAYAFNAIGDLAVDVVLSQKANTTFDFSTQTANTAAPLNKTVKAFFSSKGRNKGNDSSNTIQGSLLFNSKDVSDASIYATAKINGVMWNLVKPYKDNGYTTKIDVTREV